MTVKTAIIGGSGLYSLMGDSSVGDYKIIHREIIQTPYGEPSGPVIHGEVYGKPLIFIARHGYTHRIPPHKINYRANIWMLKKLGIEQVIAVNAVGGINDNFPPEKIAIPDQIIDYSYGREFTFFEQDLAEVVHIDFSYPYEETIRQALIKAAKASGIEINTSGTYGCTQGPRLETAAEIKRLAQDGCDMVGMTAMPEASLAREQSMAYASIAVSANWAAGIQQQPLDMDTILKHLNQGMVDVNTLILSYMKNL